LENVPYVPGFPPGFSYDFNVYSAKKIREKLEYMHANPVKRGLVKNPSDWLWSSFLSYEKGEGGLAPIDFTD